MEKCIYTYKWHVGLGLHGLIHGPLLTNYQRLETLWSRLVNQVHMLDFEGLTAEIRQDLAVRLRMVYSGEGQMSDTVMDLDTADTLCFQLGGVRRTLTWRQFILALRLHTKLEMAEAGDFLGPAPSYVLIRDPVRRLCHRMIAYSISGRGQAPEKVTGFDLFYFRSMDSRTINVPHLLAQYLFRHAERRKSGARLSGGHFIGRLAMHFGLVSDDGLRGLQGPERQQEAAAGAPEADEADQAAEEVAPEIPAPAPAPGHEHLPPPAPQPRTMSQRIDRLEEELMDASGQTYQPFDSTLVGSSGLSFRRRVRPRTGDASTSIAPHTDAQPDP
ncbi:hypothetical protein Tco_1497392 [Tanacetum coccineum]